MPEERAAFLLTYNDGGRLVKKRVGLVMMMGLVVSFVGCGDDDYSPTGSSVSQDMYAETIVGTWDAYGDPFWTFSSDGTVEIIGWGLIYNWEISESKLTITTRTVASMANILLRSYRCRITDSSIPTR